MYKRGILLMVCLSTGLLFGCSNHNKETGQSSAISATSTDLKEKNVKPDKEAYVKEIQAKIKANWPLMNKVWPTYNYNEHNLILFYKDSKGDVKEAWKINATGSEKLDKSKYENINVPPSMGYEAINYDGTQSIAMSTMLFDKEEMNSDSPFERNYIYTVATHELVHFYYQPSSTIDENEEDASRDTIYPASADPRIYRKMELLNLSKAYQNKEKQEEYLGKAKYWQNKWQEEYSDEAKSIHSTDIVEGPARYSEYLAESLSYSEEKQKDRNIKLLKKLDKETFDSPDSEGYELGYASGLLLDRIHNGKEWTENYYKNNKTMDEILLADVKPIKEKVDPKVKEEVTKKVDEFNKVNKKPVDSIDSYLKNNKSVALKVPVSLMQGSYEIADSLLYNKNTIGTKYGAAFKSNDSKLTVRDATVLIGKEHIIIPLDAEPTVKDGELKIDNKNIQGTAKVKEEIDSNGKKLLIVE